MRFLLTTNPGGTPPDEAMFAEMGKLVEEAARYEQRADLGGRRRVHYRLRHAAAGPAACDGRRMAQLDECYADYISSKKTSNGTVSITTVALTGHGRAALGTYTQALRDLLGGL